MAQDDSQVRSSNRKALLGVYAALDPKLKDELGRVGVTFDEPLDAYSQLLKVARGLDQQQVPRIHPIYLAFAVMAVMRSRHGAPPSDDARPQLRSVIEQLVDPARRDVPSPPGADPVSVVHSALERAAANERVKERWAQVWRQVSSDLVPELRVIEQAWCQSELRSVANEAVSRVEVRFVVRHGGTLDQITPALLPDNWRICNDFFCDLSRTPDRDHDDPDATGGNLSADAPHWRGVYQERVGACPQGWFPDTFLLFTWDKLPDQRILRYQLAPQRSGDGTVLKIDEGYLQVGRLPPDTYEVSTLKYLLFDDRFIPGGGQALGQSACELGWLDHAINQFADCSATLPGSPQPLVGVSPGTEHQTTVDAGLQQVLLRCEAYLRETATDADAQLSKIMSKVNSGRYDVNDFIGDWGDAAVRAMRDGSRAMVSQINYSLRSLDAARALAGRGDTSS
ncbi:MAG: hypothetical protein ACRDS0_00410 [Pseudonocardiaceae bacterium]